MNSVTPPGDTSDLVVIGGGVIGLSIAWECARAGMSVRLLDRDEPGRAASWAGAGMLPPGARTADFSALPASARPEAALRTLSASFWPDHVASLRDAVDLDVGYRRHGAVHLFENEQARDAAASRLATQRIGHETLDESGPTRPCLGGYFRNGIAVPDQAQVRNPRLLKALRIACERAGVSIVPHAAVRDFRRAGDRLTAAVTDAGEFAAGHFCLAAGAWTGRLAATLGPPPPVEPVRGQIALLKFPAPPFAETVEIGKRYLVPRDDGRLLVGATEERAGFAAETTAGALADLLAFAARVFPAAASATLERHWAGLRPGSPDGLPFLGPVPDAANAVFTAGHFRNGLQQSPATAVLVRELLTGRRPSIDLTPYAVDRDVVPRVTPFVVHDL
ncbi:MAG: glycine oxidase ThiO [Planctomycetota bacterium]